MPVLAACSAGARVDPFADFVLEDVGAIARPPRLAIEARPDVLKHRLLVAEVFAGSAIELPEYAVLADRERPFLRTGVHEHALEDDVEIERLARRVRVVPLKLARARVQRERRARVERDVGA